MKHQIYHRNLNHRLAGFRQRFVVFAQASIFAQPSKRPLHHPTPRKDDKAGHIVAPFDNLQNPVSKLFYPFNQLAGIAAVGPNQLQPRTDTFQFRNDQLGAVPILNIRRMDDYRNQQTQRINHNMAFSARNLLAGIITAIPPFSAVLTDWLSIIAAEGLAWRPSFRRTWIWRQS